ncbi:hypothetical protein AMECASPLE_011074 [Ameca splendens]|uniref:Uncharacterized protein n=1 Tax=Ameca splendens TaxID=208324 RepID=A0ABV0Y0Z6_9TELE
MQENEKKSSTNYTGNVGRTSWFIHCRIISLPWLRRNTTCGLDKELSLQQVSAVHPCFLWNCNVSFLFVYFAALHITRMLPETRLFTSLFVFRCTHINLLLMMSNSADVLRSNFLT